MFDHALSYSGAARCLQNCPLIFEQIELSKERLMNSVQDIAGTIKNLLSPGDD